MPYFLALFAHIQFFFYIKSWFNFVNVIIHFVALLKSVRFLSLVFSDWKNVSAKHLACQVTLNCDNSGSDFVQSSVICLRASSSLSVRVRVGKCKVSVECRQVCSIIGSKPSVVVLKD